MISNVALTLVVFFLVSLLAAYLLFKFLHSTAGIESHAYKAGGALAGFVIVYGVLFGSYYKIVKMDLESLQAKYDKLEESNAQLVNAQPIKVQVSPSDQSIQFVLAVDKQEPDTDGRLVLMPPCSLNPEGGRATIYALAQGERFVDTGSSWQAIKHLTTKEDLTNVRATVKLTEH